MLTTAWTKRFFVMLAIFLLPPGLCWGANHYIRQGATGNGSDWSNALGQLPSTLIRGDTYYLADGTYNNAYRFDDAAAGSTRIYVKKAIPADHGTDTGWSDSYGDGQAVFTGGISFQTGYWEVDGQRGAGKGSAVPYGIKVTSPTPSGRGIDIDGSYITLRYVDLQGNGPDGDGTGGTSDDGIYAVSGYTNHVYSHMYMHYFGRAPILWRGITDSIIEYCYIEENESTAGQHAEGISAAYLDATGTPTRNIVRHNTWEKIEGTGIIMIADGDGWEVYGNLVFDSSSNNGSIATWGGHPINNTRVYNNTIVDTVGYDQGIDMAGTGNVAYNNVFINCAGTKGFGATSHDYNVFDDGTYGEANAQVVTDGTALFVSYQNDDFRLKTATDVGIPLAEPYHVDRLGNTRGADGTWDRGAFEYVSGEAPTTPGDDDDDPTTPGDDDDPTTPEKPDPPTNVRLRTIYEE